MSLKQVFSNAVQWVDDKIGLQTLAARSREIGFATAAATAATGLVTHGSPTAMAGTALLAISSLASYCFYEEAERRRINGEHEAAPLAAAFCGATGVATGFAAGVVAGPAVGLTVGVATSSGLALAGLGLKKLVDRVRDWSNTPS